MHPAPPRSAELLLTPENRKLVESLGMQPGIWGALFLAVACTFGLHGDGPASSTERVVFGVSTALGLSLIGYEIWRRGNRTVLVRNGAQIAVYRKGRLDLMLAPGDIATEKVPFPVMLKTGVPLGLAALLFSAVGILSHLRDRSGSVDGLLILFMGLVCWASLASAAWTTFSCRRLRVPIKGSRWLSEETFLACPSRLREVFPELAE